MDGRVKPGHDIGVGALHFSTFLILASYTRAMRSPPPLTWPRLVILFLRRQRHHLAASANSDF